MATLKKEFEYWKKKVDLYKEPLKNQERVRGLRVTTELYKKPHIKNYIWQIRREVNSEQNVIQSTNKELINKIEAAKKEFEIIKAIVDEKPILISEVYIKKLNENRQLRVYLYRINEKLGEAQAKEQFLNAEYLEEFLHGKKTVKKQLPIFGERMCVLDKENENLSKEIERKQFKLSEVQSRIENLQSEISKLSYGLTDFK